MTGCHGGHSHRDVPRPGDTAVGVAAPPHLAPFLAARFFGGCVAWRAAATTNGEPRLVGVGRLQPAAFLRLVRWVADGLMMPPPDTVEAALPFLADKAPVLADRSGTLFVVVDDCPTPDAVAAVAHLSIDQV